MLHKPSVRVGIALLVLLMTGAGVAYWYYMRIFVGTDDAYVSGHVGVISPRVPGQVMEVPVDNNFFVQPEQVLVTLDPTNYEVAVAHAEAALNQLRQEMARRYVTVAKAQAQVDQARANFRLWEIDKVRYSNLYKKGTVPKQTLDQVETRYNATRAEVDKARQELNEALAFIGGATSIPQEVQPAVKEAKARLEQAQLELEYTQVKAQVKGYITRRQVQPGNWVRPGQPLMTLVPLDYRELWIEANYKETQLTEVYIGQEAAVTVDTYPNVKFTGRVDSIMAGTGAAFSLLPPENATGNWVKVVQRIPVKIVLRPPFPENQPLRLGMSCYVKIDTRKRTGPRLLTQKGGKMGGGG